MGRKQEKPIDQVNVARVIGALGGTDEQLAAALGISRQALHKRQGKNPALVDTLKAAKAEADSRVERALYQRAIGYEAPDTHFSTYEGSVTETAFIKHYPPDPVSCIFWLKNRKPKEWREKTETELSGTVAGLPEDLVRAIQERAAQKAKANGPAS